MSEIRRWVVLRRHIDGGLVTGVALDIVAVDRRDAGLVAAGDMPRPDNDLCEVYYEASPVHPRYPSPRAGILRRSATNDDT